MELVSHTASSAAVRVESSTLSEPLLVALIALALMFALSAILWVVAPH